MMPFSVTSRSLAANSGARPARTCDGESKLCGAVFCSTLPSAPISAIWPVAYQVTSKRSPMTLKSSGMLSKRAKLALAPGAHTLTLKHPMAPTDEREITAVAGEELVIKKTFDVPKPAPKEKPVDDGPVKRGKL